MGKYYTANGVEITSGLRVFTNDWVWGVVTLEAPWYGDGWFTVRLDNGRSRGYDGSRMTTAQPK